mmetsp:Transcript_2589/g.6012  ORF Transcript_2589/g.6012 Transcript_2589/m.6012 type:complete len:239 (+) Transcript_2589:574-1290(+)
MGRVQLPHRPILSRLVSAASLPLHLQLIASDEEPLLGILEASPQLCDLGRTGVGPGQLQLLEAGAFVPDLVEVAHELQSGLELGKAPEAEHFGLFSRPNSYLLELLQGSGQALPALRDLADRTSPQKPRLRRGPREPHGQGGQACGPEAKREHGRLRDQLEAKPRFAHLFHDGVGLGHELVCALGIPKEGFQDNVRSLRLGIQLTAAPLQLRAEVARSGDLFTIPRPRLPDDSADQLR